MKDQLPLNERERFIYQKNMKQFWENNKKNLWFWLFVVLALATAVAMPLMALDAGNSGDEDGFQVPQGRNVINYFETHGADTTCFTFGNLMYYGSSPDVITEYVNRKCGIEDIHVTRHLFNAMTGWLAILAVGLIACMIGGFRAGVFAMLLLFLSPRFLGHSFNNPKDIPFAAAVIMAVYGMLLFFKQFPKVKWYTFVILILSFAFAVSVRVGGLILVGYFGLFGFVYLVKVLIERRLSQRSQTVSVQQKGKKNVNKTAKRLKSSPSFGKLFIRMLWMGILICVVGFFAGLLLWPYALKAPVKHTLEAFQAMSNFDSLIRQLFEGTFIYSDGLPWYYLPKLILLTTPIAVFIGAVLYFFFGMFKKENWFYAGALWFAFLFPIVWIIYTDANVYCGWRHVLFCYPPLAALAGLGFSGLIGWAVRILKAEKPEPAAEAGDAAPAQESTKTRLIRIGVNAAGTLLLLGLLANPIRHIAVNHPYEYVFFNKTFGGMANAYGNYELDYYYHTTRAACEWLQKNALPPVVVEGDTLYKPNPKIQVATWHPASVAYFLRKDTARFAVKFSRWDKLAETDWDYGIFTITGIDPAELKNKTSFPPVNCVHTIEVDGYPICFIVRHENKSDLMARLNHNELVRYRLLDAHGTGLLERTRFYLADAYAYNPYNRSLLTNYLEFNEALGQMDSLKKYVDLKLKCLPRDEIATFYKGYYYQRTGDDDKAIQTYRDCIKLNCKYAAAYKGLAEIYKKREDWNSLEKLLLKQVDENIFNSIGNDVAEMVNMYKKQGMSEPYAYKRAYKLIAEHYQAAKNAQGYKIYNDAYQKLAAQLK